MRASSPQTPQVLFVRTKVLASNAPVPGGGGASALVGAIGTALGNMVGSLTVGKKKYADVEEEIIALKAKCDSLQKELLEQIALDAKGFEPLAKAYGIPKDDPSVGGQNSYKFRTRRLCKIHIFAPFIFAS